MKEFLNFINGEYVRNASGKTFQDINPVNGSVIGNIYEAGEVEVNAAVAAAKAALKGDWGRLSVAERCKLLDAVAARCAVPIIASGGAGKKEDFLELFRNHPAVDAGLAASIFHTKQVEINDLKRYLRENGVEMRV